MANFVIIVDANTERRTGFIKSIRPLIAPIDGLNVDECHRGDCSVVWAASPHAPISIDQDDVGLSVIWGDAIQPESSDRETAAALRQTWQHPPGKPYDGFYAACTYTPRAGLQVGVDLLGFFPLYFWGYAGGAVVASSPELLRHHCCFTPKLALEGLIGALLLQGLANNCALWHGVKRLAPGNIVTVTPDGSVQERRQYRVPCSQADMDQAGYALLSFEEQVEILAKTVDQAIARHAPAADPQILLLTGGLDSRTLASFLHRQGTSPHLLTFGRSDDLEAICAKAVAQQLGWPHQIYDGLATLTQTDQLTTATLKHAEFLTTWGHLAGTSSSFTGSFIGTSWSQHRQLNPNGCPIIHGYAMDRVICGSRLAKHSFDKALERECKVAGLLPDVLRRLLRPENGSHDCLEQVLEEMCTHYEQYSDIENQRTWLMSLYHSNRFILGLAAWQCSFTAWPRIPVIDQRLLAVSGQLPGETTNKRRAQKAIIQQLFPNLARLPLDRNAFYLETLNSSSQQQRLQPLRKFQQTWWKLQKRLGHDRRPFFRSYNINRPELQALRQQAQTHRDKLADLVDLAVLEELLPQQAVISYQKDPIKETKRFLKLTGVLLWSGSNM